jgi:GntR family transcriptional regulator/MocR family aminotransferase
MSLPIPIDRNSASTLQEQIYRYIRQQILSGAYPPGMRLCSTRELADSLKVSRNTTVLAYEWLASEGYVDSQTGAGTFVSNGLIHRDIDLGITDEDAAARKTDSHHGEYPPIVVPYALPELLTRSLARPAADFFYGRVDPRQFPAKIWRRLLMENLLSVPTTLVDYAPFGGLLKLREAIAEHLVTAKGIVATPEQIIITAGAQDALNVIARLFIERGTPVGIETPGYASAVTLFRSYGACLHPLALDAEGVMAKPIAAAGPRLIYITPSHQFPTGVTMSPARRQGVLAAAEAAGAYIIEDDYDGEIIYDRPPIAALAALDQSRRVIYVGSFSKSLGAGIRTGFLVVPPQLAAPASAIKTLASYGQPWLEQAALAAYIGSGGYAAHLRRIRTLYRERRDTLIESVQRCFGSHTVISGHEAGLHVVCTLPSSMPDAHCLAALARSHGIGLYTPTDAGVHEFEPPSPPERRLIMGYASLTPAEISKALSMLSSALTAAHSGGAAAAGMRSM